MTTNILLGAIIFLLFYIIIYLRRYKIRRNSTNEEFFEINEQLFEMRLTAARFYKRKNLKKLAKALYKEALIIENKKQ